jgi:hypothetical protein
MLVHIHTMRNWCATALVLVPAPLLLGWASTPESKDLRLVQVSGRVTCNDRPFRGTIHFLPEAKGVAHAMGPVKPDGSFQLYVNGRTDLSGAVPGTYRVVLQPRIPDMAGSCVDGKYRDSRTTDLVVHVGPDWNYVRVDLH